MLRLAISKTALLLRRSAEQFLDDNCTQMAAAISYYVLFSLFPLLIFLVGVLGLFLRDGALQEDIIDGVLDVIPLTQDEGRDQVTEAVRGVAGVGSGALGILGLLGMAWSGSNVFAVIRRSLNAAYDLDRQRPFVQQKLVDLAMVAAMGALFLASVSATTALRVARRFSGDLAVLGDAAEAAGPLWTIAIYLVPLVLSFVAFAALYWFVPAASIRLGDIWPGALTAAVLFELAKLGFAVYLENFSRYDVVYGSLGAVATFLFWVYLSANVLLFGAEVASEYAPVMRGDYDTLETKPAEPLRRRIRRRLRSLFVSDDEGEGGGKR